MAKKSKASNTRNVRLRAQHHQSTHGAIKQQLIDAGKVLVAEGQDDFTRGHISFRLPDDPSRFFMKAHSVGLDEITPQNILTIDLEGNVVAGSARRHSEVYIHSEILKVRPDLNCVIHTHPTYSIALSATGRPLRCYSQPGALFYEALGTYSDTINLIRTQAMGAGVARALGRGSAVLLKNHGVVVAGATIEEAVIRTIMLENGAMVQLLAEAAGDPAPEFSPADIERLKADISQPEQFKINFHYLVRRIRRRK
jgi:ribulose-5-phosphate 4-epimerase/fuculose-1-phosphate aldolase